LAAAAEMPYVFNGLEHKLIVLKKHVAFG